MDKVKDAIIENFENSMEAWRGLATTDNMFLIGRIDANEMAIETVKYMFKTVGHGQWLDEDSFDAHGSPIYRCSVCNRTVADNYISCHKFCLHCGADMRGAKENE